MGIMKHVVLQWSVWHQVRAF